jgi:hypothetical protein
MLTQANPASSSQSRGNTAARDCRVVACYHVLFKKYRFASSPHRASGHGKPTFPSSNSTRRRPFAPAFTSSRPSTTTNNLALSALRCDFVSQRRQDALHSLDAYISAVYQRLLFWGTPIIPDDVLFRYNFPFRQCQRAVVCPEHSVSEMVNSA